MKFKDYKIVKVPLDKTDFEIKLEKSPSGFERDGVMYELLENFRFVNAKTADDTLKNVRVPNIRVVKLEELTDDGEGIMIEEIE